jgi:RNA polymerase I-specific transcription initiation factor RRN5
MSTSAEDETFPDNREDILGPPENIPILSSSKPWRDSPSSHLGEESQPDRALVLEEGEHEIDESEDKVNEVEGEPSESENEVSKSESSRSRSKGDLDSWIRRNKRHYINRASLALYRSLLKEKEIDSDTSEPNTAIDGDSTGSAKIDLVEWTSEETDKLFAALSRKGKYRAHEIAQLVGSKSQSEVSEYIQLLEDAARDEALREIQPSEKKTKQKQHLLARAIPAAAEISEEVEKSLEMIVEHVSILEQRTDNLEGEKIHGPGFWTIDSNAAKKVEEILESKQQEPVRSQSSIFQSAGLFNIKQWIRLSERLFMNAGESQFEDNWRNLAFEGESPSLTADAFSDFYTLTRDITKCLVEKTFSVAHDRVGTSKRKTALVARREDVLDAAKLLHMKRNSFRFYVRLARRLRLDVADIVNKKGEQEHNEYLSYDKVEKILSQKKRRKTDVTVNGSDDAKDDFEESSTLSDEDSEIYRDDDQLGRNREETSSSQADDETSIPNDSQNEDTENTEPEQIEYDRKVDEYLEYFDRQSGKQAEAELRAVFKENSYQFDVNTEEEAAEPPPIPTRQTPQGHETVDWRTDLVYRIEWDFERQIPTRPKKRRRIE